MKEIILRVLLNFIQVLIMVIFVGLVVFVNMPLWLFIMLSIVFAFDLVTFAYRIAGE